MFRAGLRKKKNMASVILGAVRKNKGKHACPVYESRRILY